MIGADPPPLVTPSVVAASMGYGHLRAAAALADHLGVALDHADRPPLAGRIERLIWGLTRRSYHYLSRFSQTGARGAFFGPVLDRLTAIPNDSGDSRVSLPGSVRFLDLLVRLGFGRRLGLLADSRGPLLSTFYANAIAAGHHGSGPVACVVTDSHVHRVWAPRRPASSRIVYFVPVDGTAACLADYGVHPDHVRVTGFPLPSELVGIGQEALRRHFLARLGRLRRMTRSRAVTSSDPLTITVAVGGAGAQVHHIRSLLTELRHELKTGAIRLVLVAGTHEWAARMFRGWVSREVEKGLPPDAVAILVEATFTDYYRAFNRQLAHTDILWTKPSELVFYAGLGLPLVLEEPVGAHEEHNGELIITAGAGVRRPPAGQLAPWLRHMMDSGHFIRAAEAGRDRFSANGTTRIASYCSTDLYNEFTRG